MPPEEEIPAEAPVTEELPAEAEEVVAEAEEVVAEAEETVDYAPDVNELKVSTSRVYKETGADLEKSKKA